MAETKTLADEFGIKLEPQLDQNRVLFLLEDQQDLRLIVTHHLGKLGFAQIKQFTNGHEALQFLRDNPSIQPVVTICDLEMPLMGGYDYFSELRENPNYSRGPFAITLPQPDKAQIMLASENGVDGILVKPYTFKDIVPKLRQAHKIFNNPNNPELVYELAKTEFRACNWDRSEFIFKRLAASSEKAARPIVGLARVAIEQKKYEPAMQYLIEAEKRNPHYVHTYVERGRLCVMEQKIEDGVKFFRKAIELSPLNPMRYEEAAELLFRLNRFQEAVDLLTIALDNQVAFPRLHHIMSQGYFALKDFKKATRHVKSALAHEPENVSYLNQLGVCYKESELYDDATKVYNTVIKLDPDNRSALYNKAIMLAAKGQAEEAVKLLQRCVLKHPDFEQAARKLKEIKEKATSPKAG
ncbi:MAG: tetratricopeptide repeat protein [Chitinophagaceae bacterium]|nr:tetratricopeptide repeat protein [Oligoflexus sp.]